jgi:hypothetical protein
VKHWNQSQEQPLRLRPETLKLEALAKLAPMEPTVPAVPLDKMVKQVPKVLMVPLARLVQKAMPEQLVLRVPQDLKDRLVLAPIFSILHLSMAT